MGVCVCVCVCVVVVGGGGGREGEWEGRWREGGGGRGGQSAPLTQNGLRVMDHVVPTSNDKAGATLPTTSGRPRSKA